MRRTTSIVAIAVLTVTAGCIGGLGGGGDQQPQGPPPIDHVPSGVESIASYDASVVSDPATTTVINTYLQETIPEDSDQPRTVDGMLSQFQNETAGETNVSVSSISGAVVFSKFPSMGSLMMGGQPDVYTGVLLRTGWSEDEIVSEIRDNVTETTYEGTTIYLAKQSEMAGTTGFRIGMAKYGEDLWVIGTEQVVKDVIDVSNGNADAFSGQLRQMYESTRSDAYVRAAIEIPEEYRTVLQRMMRQGMGPGMGGGASDLPVGNVTHLSMSYYTEGGQDGTIGTNLAVRFDAQDVAESMKDQVEGAISFAEGQVENETLKKQIEAINVSREGQTLSLNYESAVSDLQTVIRQFASEQTMAGGAGAGQSASSSGPSAQFDYQWNGADGRLTVVHAGGETIDGENLRAICGDSVLETPDGPVQAGTTLVDTGKCSSGDTVRIVWRSSSSGPAEILSTFEIPGSAHLSAPAAAPA